MKKTLLLMLALVSTLILAACGETLEGVESIQLIGTIEQEYDLNEIVDLNQFQVKVNLENGTNQTLGITNSLVTVTGATDDWKLDTSKAGTFMFKVEYKGFKVELEYTVVNPAAWNGVTVSEPTKDGDTYLVGSPAEYKWIVDESRKETSPLVVKSIKLTSDIDFNGKEIERIQMVAEGFTFDGQGHSLLNVPESFRGVVNYLTLSHEAGKEVTFKNFKLLNINLTNTNTVGLLAYGPTTTAGVATTRGVINVDNVEITGKMVLMGTINSAMFGYIQSAEDSTRTVINVTNTKMAVRLTSPAENVGLFVGHGQALLKLDKSSREYVDLNSQVVTVNLEKLGNRRFYHGNSNGNHVVVVENEIQTVLTAENLSKLSKTLTSVEISAENLSFGSNVTFKKAAGSVKTIVTIQYQLEYKGYTRIIRDIVDTSTFANGADVVSVLKKLRITQDSALQNNTNYYYVPESSELFNQGITSSGIITILQLDANNNVISLQRHAYNPTTPLS